MAFTTGGSAQASAAASEEAMKMVRERRPVDASGGGFWGSFGKPTGSNDVQSWRSGGSSAARANQPAYNSREVYTPGAGLAGPDAINQINQQQEGTGTGPGSGQGVYGGGGNYRTQGVAAYEDAMGNPVHGTWGTLASVAAARPTAEQLGYDPSLWNDPTRVSGIAADPASIAAQQQALASLRERYAGGGLDAIDRARIEEARMGSAQFEQGQRQAIAQEMASRGLSSSGTALAGMLGAQQAGANRLAQEQMGVEAMAQQRRDQTLRDIAAQAAQLRGTSFAEELVKARSMDEQSIFNLEAQTEAAKADAAARQQAWENMRGIFGLGVGVRQFEEETRYRDETTPSAGWQTVGNIIQGAGGIAKAVSGGGG